MVSKAHVMALAAGDTWLEKGANVLLFGPPGAGKTHLAAAIGLALVENGWRVLFTRTSELVQRLQIARRELGVESAIAKLDKYHLIILDDWFVWPTLSREDIGSIASGRHEMDALVGRYVHDELLYRYIVVQDGKEALAIEAAIKSGAWCRGRPF